MNKFVDLDVVYGSCNSSRLGWCTFDVYKTLTVCSMVENVTDRLVQHADAKMPSEIPSAGLGPEIHRNTTIHS